MVAHKRERDHANCFKNARVDNDGAAQLPFQLRRNTEGLGNDRHDDDAHADQSKATSFSELRIVSFHVAVGCEEYLPLQCLGIKREGMRCPK